MRTSQPRLLNSLLAARMLANSYGMSSMPYGGSGMSLMPYGGYGMSSMPYGGYGSYSPGDSAPTLTTQPPESPPDDDIEVSGPLDIPPPHRAIIRLRLPRTWIDVSIDGRKIDSMGKSRTYVTPELSAARTFEVTATWKNNGQTLRLQGQVTVDAGQIRTLDFTSGK
jgi:uncharacterized protein (TIGR03000 family)